jgi:hypothetical protein
LEAVAPAWSHLQPGHLPWFTAGHLPFFGGTICVRSLANPNTFFDVIAVIPLLCRGESPLIFREGSLCLAKQPVFFHVDLTHTELFRKKNKSK